MKIKKFSKKPDDINDRIGAKPIVCYPNNNIEEKNLDILHTVRKNLVKKSEISTSFADGFFIAFSTVLPGKSRGEYREVVGS